MKSKNFLLFSLANTSSSLGDYIYDIAIVVHLYKVTGSPIIMGSFFILQFLPSLIFTVIAGGIIDRINKKNILIFSNLIRAIVLLFLLINVSTTLILISAIILGICDELSRSTSNAVIPSLLNKDEMVRGNSVLSALDSLTMIVGPLIAGLLISSIGIKGSIIANFTTFIISTILLSMIKIEFKENKNIKSQENFMGEIKEGIGFIFSSTFLRKIILIWGLLLIGVGISGSLIIVLIKDYMHLPSNTYGWISTAEGIGILLGSYLLIRKKNNIGHINLIKNGLFLIGFALLVISFNNNLPLLLVLYLAIGMGAASAPVGIRSLIQVNVPDVILGRVFLTVRFIVSTLRTLAIAIGSIFADFFDLRIIFFVAAIFILFASFISRSIFKGKTKSLSF